MASESAEMRYFQDVSRHSALLAGGSKKGKGDEGTVAMSGVERIGKDMLKLPSNWRVRIAA